MKLKLAFLFLAVILAAALFSCSGPAGKPADSGTNDLTTESQKPEETEIKYKADIPDKINYNGATVTAYTYPENIAGATWVDVDFCATEEIGETINDATYMRMRFAEEALGVDIVNFAPGDYGGSALRRSVTVNDGAYDFAFINTNATGTLAEGGLIMNIRNISQLNLDAPWWDQNCTDGLSVGGKVYMLAGDISIMPKKTLRVYYFNKALAADYDIPNPYELVDQMAWTVESLSSISRAVSDDLNGDGKMDKNDRFGILFRSNTIYPMLIANGVTCAVKDSDDMPVLSFYNEHTQSSWDKLTNMLYDSYICFSQDRPGGTEIVPMFVANQGLFMSAELHNVQIMRDMVDDFGILPNPMFDESQKNYYSTINPHVAAMLVIPTDCPDTERAAYVLDVMGAESKNILTPAYIDTYLKGKVSRDVESEATLNIIINNVVYDIGLSYNWGKIGFFAQEIFSQQKTDLSSSYATVEKAAQKALDKSINAYLKNAN